jgi:hypothetical protein
MPDRLALWGKNNRGQDEQDLQDGILSKKSLFDAEISQQLVG